MFYLSAGLAPRSGSVPAGVESFMLGRIPLSLLVVATCGIYRRIHITCGPREVVLTLARINGQWVRVPDDEWQPE